MIAIGTFIVSFGLYNVHEQNAITEGGILGAVLLIHHWTGLSVGFVSFSLDIVSYLLAYKYLGWDFIKKSMIATILMATYLAIFERYPPLLTLEFMNGYLIALIGGIFVGVGVGIVIRYGGSCGGDDALALIIASKLKLPLRYCYIFTDVTVLLLSLSYISFSTIQYSFLTVIVSSFLIDWVNKLGRSTNYENETL